MDVGGDISGNRIYLSFVRNVFVFTLKPSERMSLLDNINSPSDLRSCRWSVCRSCARSFAVSSYASWPPNPGHLGSSLGAIELTVAIHYVYDTPDDKLVWDVGHQGYAP